MGAAGGVAQDTTPAKDPTPPTAVDQFQRARQLHGGQDDRMLKPNDTFLESSRRDSSSTPTIVGIVTAVCRAIEL